MARTLTNVACLAALSLMAAHAAAHCRVMGNGYLRGSYDGDCDEKSELAQGHGEATGIDRYAGDFVRGRPEGTGVYTWASGARLEGTFKAGKGDGPGVYVSGKGVRYEGPFENGKLTGARPEDCPVTQGPLGC